MKSKPKAWVMSADMGYGHQRAAYPLKDIATERIINSNSDKIVSKEDKKTWIKARAFYEWISRMNEIPVLGRFLFWLFNRLQEIKPYYPFRDASTPNSSVKFLHRKIAKGFGKSLLAYVSKERAPIVSTFYIPALVADYHHLPAVYCVICDSDINRIWVAKDPKKSKINYFVPCIHAYNRLLSYGVAEKQLFLTGFPLPKENIGGESSPITKKVLARRLVNLDPQKKFLSSHKSSIKQGLGKYFIFGAKPKPITLMFVVGGAGAQSDIGFELLKSLKHKLLDNKISICIVVGTHIGLKDQFSVFIDEIGLKSRLDKNLTILAELTKKDYFAKFNEQLNKTDILWTKPSELSFYSGLGVPIIMAPPLGAQEYWNRKWLFEIGAGSDQEAPEYVSEWLFEKLNDGRLARKAWNGFLNAPRLGTYNIEKILKNHGKE
ncbi:hypothetical protein COV13_02775 [Candidatus Woesearchaeota archaeon CG10_big_fil_rev_8_21_14_0_10_32_9]|nr:MAG: hypothetical protein COV13_02775 [Candidatus Woesearchaeota archaeon CG10_big_fil_rev_8_21_14_0_10_32_9]